MLAFCILVILLFVLFLIKRPHLAILTYVPCSILFQNYICLRLAPPALSLQFVLDLIFVIYFLIYRRVKYVKFPFYHIFVFLFLIIILGVIVSPLSLSQVLFNAIKIIISYSVVVVFYFELRKKQDLKYSTIVIGMTFLFFCLYAFAEYFYQVNFLHEYIYLTNNPEYLQGKLYLTHEVRYSSIRCSSFFPISISWGGFCCLVMSFFSFLYVINRKKPSTIVYILFICVIAFCVLISGSRASMIYFLIILLAITTLYNKNVGLIIFVLSFVVLIWGGEYAELLFKSMQSKSDIVMGSSIDMRINQFDAALEVLSNSPIFGFGIKGGTIALKYNSDLLGSESIWLQQFISYGIIGVVFQFLLYYNVYKIITEGLEWNKKVYSIFFLTGWIVFCTLTTSPGLSEPYFLSLVILLIRYKKFKCYESINISSRLWSRIIYRKMCS